MKGVAAHMSEKDRFRKKVGKIIKDKELFYGSIVLIIFFSIVAPMFFTLDNISNILRSASVGGMLTLGLAFVMMTGDFDLSFGTATGLLVVTCMIMLDAGYPLGLTFGIMIIMGITWELFNALLVVGIKMHAFVATIASLSLVKGFIYWITKGQTVYGHFPKALPLIGRGNVFEAIPICALIFLFFAMGAYILANNTKFGRHLYAVGNNPEAASYAGIKVTRCRILAYVLSGFCLGIAAIILASMLTSAPVGAGDGFQMTVIASCFLGATVFKPGVVNIGGSVLSIFLLGIVENGFIMLDFPFYFRFIFQGLIIIAAVAFISLKNRKLGIAGKGPAIF
jgi:ribose/xylose/arabinose/galactoside ABC-type transport system permease subunit